MEVADVTLKTETSHPSSHLHLLLARIIEAIALLVTAQAMVEVAAGAAGLLINFVVEILTGRLVLLLRSRTRMMSIQIADFTSWVSLAFEVSA